MVENSGKIIVFAILLVAILAIGAYLYVNSPQTSNIISVRGNSELSAKPDLVSVYISIETLNSSAEISKNTNSEISEQVLRELRYLGFDDSEIESVSFNIYPDYSWENYQQRLKGYKTVNQIKVKTSDFGLTGKIVDAAVDSGALIQYINFEFTKEKENELKAKALEEATKDAKIKAEAVARGANKKLGKLVSINTDEYYYRPYELYAKSVDVASDMNAEEARRASTQINPQELKVYANVQASYQIK
ncbi:MAG: SIMPL domain-containing protein [Candidatus Pacearchaeota archaeon]